MSYIDSFKVRARGYPLDEW